MYCGPPAISEEVVREAVNAPPDDITDAVPRLVDVLKSVKVTVPVGVPSAGESGVTVAVSVSAWP
jgi:hypothetical protein